MSAPRTLRIGGRRYPVVLPSWKDPRLHVSATFLPLHVLGQVWFHFQLSFPQIAFPILTCALIELVVSFWQRRVIFWPASALLTGNGIAFILRIPGTRHGDWWSVRGWWVYVATAAVAMASKYLIQFRGRHVFNPANVALVLCFLILGSSHSEPLQFWWGPLSPALFVVLAVIVTGALVVLSRVGLLRVAALFWVTFVSALGVLALSGHAFSANWNLGPVANGYFWKVLITSPEVFIFMCFMITDPRTVPETARGRRVYALAIGLLGALLIAPMRTEYWAKVGLLGSLALVCAARPLLILAREALERRGRRPRLDLSRRRPLEGVLALTGATVFAALIVVAGSPARSLGAVPPGSLGSAVAVTIHATPGVVSIDAATGREIAAGLVGDLRLVDDALRLRNPGRAAAAAAGPYLAQLRSEIARSRGRAVVVSDYRVSSVDLHLLQAVGQAPPTVVATLSGRRTPLTYAAGSTSATQGATTRFSHVFDLALSGGRLLIVGEGGEKLGPVLVAPPASIWGGANRAKGVGSFSKLRLVDVAAKVGLDFRQDAFRYSMTYDPQAMMGGGVCWIDYNNDGWESLFAVNSYADADMPKFESEGGLPQSALFENVHGHFVNVTAKAHAGLAVKGNGCAAADLTGDGYTDLVVSTATGVDVLWNNGNGTFSESALPAPYGWYSGIAIADVNGDGRPDIFVSGYTEMWDQLPNSIAGFPNNYGGVRDLLFLNEGNGPGGRARFKEVGVEAGLETAADPRHGLGAIFTDLTGDGRPDLYVANDSDPNDVYINEPGGPLGFHFVEESKAFGIDNTNAGMGVAEADINGDGRPDLFITNSRGQPHAAFVSKVLPSGRTVYVSESARFARDLDRRETVGWGDAFVDFQNSGELDLILANGAIPVTNLKLDTEPLQLLQGLGGGRFTNASGIIQGVPRIIGRGLAAADVDNNGRMAVAINTIGGPLVLLEPVGPVGHWLDVSLQGFEAGAVLSARLPDGRTTVEELHAGDSYLSSSDPRAHFGLGKATRVALLTIRWPDGQVTRLRNVAADRVLDVARPPARAEERARAGGGRG